MTKENEGKPRVTPNKSAELLDHIVIIVQNVQRSHDDEKTLVSGWYDHPEPGCTPDTSMHALERPATVSLIP